MNVRPRPGGKRPGPRSGGRPPRPRPKVDQARLAAYDVLRAVAAEDAYANLVLPERLRARGLEGRDAAFATELAAGTLRRQGTYDAVLSACARRPVTRIDPPVLDALRLGAHQLLSMRVPSHAAVGTTVDLVRQEVGHGPAGFVNAVLRRVAEQTLDAWVRAVAPDPGGDPRGFQVVWQSHPRWVVDALAESLGERADELDALLAADNEAPRVTLVARPGLVDREELLAVEGAEPTRWSPLGVTLGSGDPGAIEAVRRGRAAVQDEGSQLVALAALAVPLEGGHDRRWLDTCAGPGGKAALWGAEAARRGAHLLAGERAPHRAALVERAVAAVPAGVVEVVVADATDPPWGRDEFDRVVVDAPCSGLGALRRRPESRWRRTPGDVEALVPLQRALLDRAIDATRPGGLTAYVTCSPVLAETAGVVEQVLAGRNDVELLDADEVAADVLRAVPDHAGPLAGTVQLWPHRHGTDAMFLALLRRRQVVGRPSTG
ncbi:RsmB/NOP family class I SAM-dependent RNA methyltransferase [Nocardioides marmoribigeumensis]|uniref:16S rRNA (Cytosine967-C5)-methyltransferase n=1 Tax=Nocardioides marmoribigeumensis TaxID=433649 RepID=A0ABU2BQR2_9ACTN|nr:transcription antitermination factor NusB [Nocardioides marmoribigeumensis]MDR7360980.1 16S rRNA (cytosine967-C5)-methyltransferase [Nocardioides marmoribigeumensis]